MKIILRLLPLLILLVAFAPPTAAIPAAVETRLTPTFTARRAREHDIFNTMRATYQARYPTPTPYVQPTFTPQPVFVQTTPSPYARRGTSVSWTYSGTTTR